MEKNAFWTGFEKRAADDSDPSWWQKQKGTQRAVRAGDKGWRKNVVDPELNKAQLKKGLTHGLVGGAAGAGLGAGLGALLRGRSGARFGAGLGGLTGWGGGLEHGVYSADKEFLKKKGITSKYLGMSADFSPEAKAKYIDAYNKKS